MTEVTGAEGSVTPPSETPSLSPENRLAQIFGSRLRPNTIEATPDAAVSSSEEAAPAVAPEASETSAEAATPATDAETETDAAEAPAETAPPRWDTLPEDVVGKLKIDGQEVEVSLSDLKKGFSFQSHNTKVSQKLAEDRKALEAQQKETSELRERYAQALPQIEAFLQKTGQDRFASIDWQRLSREDPEQFAQLRAEYDLHREQLGVVQQERQVEEKRIAEERQQNFQASVERETALVLEKVPAWREESVRNAELEGMFNFALNLGFERDALLSTYDHRVLLLMRSAYLHDKQQRDAEAARLKRDTKPAVKTVAPGANEPEQPEVTQDKVTRELKRKLQKSGRVEDAAALFGVIRGSR